MAEELPRHAVFHHLFNSVLNQLGAAFCLHTLWAGMESGSRGWLGSAAVLGPTYDLIGLRVVKARNALIAGRFGEEERRLSCL